MKVKEITKKTEDRFSYKDSHWFSDQKFIISIRDNKFDRNIIPIILVDNRKLFDLDEYEFENKIWTVTNHNKDDKPLTRFFNNQIICINYGNVIYNNNESDKLPKIKTYNENVNYIKENQIFEFFDGKIIEENSFFKPSIPEIYKLLKDVYIETEQSFYIIENNSKLFGPFKATKVIDDYHIKIIKSSWGSRFGEYLFDKNAFLEFEANEINRKIFINDCDDLELKFKNEYDFISDDELLERFRQELSNYPDYFNEKNLENVLTIIRKATEIEKVKNNHRLQNLLTKGGKILDRDIDLLKNIPEIKQLKEDKQKIEEELFVLERELDENRLKKENIQNEIHELERTKTDELEKRKIDLGGEIAELEDRRKNLNEEVEKEKFELEKKIDKTKDDVAYYERTKTELIQQIDTLREDFKEEQKKAQIILQNLIKSKIHFDFISGRDLSEQESEKQSFQDFKVNDQFTHYRDFRNDLVIILKQHNRNFDSHFVDNLLISIFQNTLTVFAGVPGTGKTSLARLLVNLLAPKERVREVSVSRGWTSQKDFIGFVNPLTKKFHSSSTDIYSLLKQLDYETENEDIYLNSPMSFIVLDEANLSPLEHYWSSFYNLTDSSGMLVVKLGHNETIKYPNNLRFIGTINYDHTTEELSPRVLDRINIIQLDKNIELNLSDFSNRDVKNIEMTYKKCLEFFELVDFNSIDIKIEEKIEHAYKEIKNEFNKLKIAISTRVEIAIKRYINLASKCMSDVNKPLDYCVAQRLLPLINLQGSENKQKLDSLKAILKDNKCTISIRLLEVIIEIGSEKGINEDNYNYFLTLSNV